MKYRGKKLFILYTVTCLFILLILPLGYCQDVCQYLSQEGGVNEAGPISVGGYIYHRQIVFRPQADAKPIFLEISYTYESIGSNSITVGYRRIEKKKLGEDFVSFRSPSKAPIQETFSVPFNKDKRAVLRVREEPLGGYVKRLRGGRLIHGVCNSEPGQDIPLLVNDQKQLVINKQEAGKK